MEKILLVIHIFIALALIGIILIQKTSSDGLGLSGGGNNNFLSGRASANLLTKITALLATLFMVNSLFLAYLASHTSRNASIVDTIEKKIEKTEPKEPSVPLAQ